MENSCEYENSKLMSSQITKKRILKELNTYTEMMSDNTDPSSVIKVMCDKSENVEKCVLDDLQSENAPRPFDSGYDASSSIKDSRMQTVCPQYTEMIISPAEDCSINYAQKDVASKYHSEIEEVEPMDIDCSFSQSTLVASDDVPVNCASEKLNSMMSEKDIETWSPKNSFLTEAKVVNDSNVPFTTFGGNNANIIMSEALSDNSFGEPATTNILHPDCDDKILRSSDLSNCNVTVNHPQEGNSDIIYSKEINLNSTSNTTNRMVINSTINLNMNNFKISTLEAKDTDSEAIKVILPSLENSMCQDCSNVDSAHFAIENMLKSNLPMFPVSEDSINHKFPISPKKSERKSNSSLKESKSSTLVARNLSYQEENMIDNAYRERSPTYDMDNFKESSNNTLFISNNSVKQDPNSDIAPKIFAKLEELYVEKQLIRKNMHSSEPNLNSFSLEKNSNKRKVYDTSLTKSMLIINVESVDGIENQNERVSNSCQKEELIETNLTKSSSEEVVPAQQLHNFTSNEFVTSNTSSEQEQFMKNLSNSNINELELDENINTASSQSSEYFAVHKISASPLPDSSEQIIQHVNKNNYSSENNHTNITNLLLQRNSSAQEGLENSSETGAINEKLIPTLFDGKHENASIEDDGEFQTGANLILKQSDFDYLLSKGSNHVQGNRSSLLLKFDPLLRIPILGYQPQGREQLSPIIGEDIQDSIGHTQNLSTKVQDTLESSLLANIADVNTNLSTNSDASFKTPNNYKKFVSMSADVIKEVHLNNESNKTFENLNINSDDKQYNYNMDELEKKIKNEVLKTEDIEKKLKDSEQREEALIKRITEKDKIISKMNGVIEAYEKAIAELIAEKEEITQNYEKQLIDVKSDRDSNYHHLTSLETTFSDLHIKYEKSKEMTLQLKANEDALIAEKKQNLENLLLQEQRYDKMKSHAMQQLEIANKKLEHITKEHMVEITKLKALLKKEEISRASISEQLLQKSRENEELVKICDELINGQGN